MDIRDLQLWSRIAAYYDLRDKIRDINNARVAQAEEQYFQEEMTRLQNEMEILDNTRTREEQIADNWEFIRMVQGGGVPL